MERYIGSEFYPRNIDNKESKIEAKTEQEIINDDLKHFNTEYKKELTEEENKKRLNLLQFLESSGFFTVENNKLVCDEEKFKNLFYSTDYPTNQKLRDVRSNTIQILSGVKTYTKEQIELLNNGKNDVPPKELIALPSNVQELVTSYPGRAENSIFKPWDVSRITRWTNDVVLPSGEKTNPGELAVVYMLQEKLKAKRDKNGELFILNPENKQYQKFSGESFEKFSGIEPKFTHSDSKKSYVKALSLGNNGVLFASKYLPNLIDSGVLKSNDFQTLGGSSTSEVFGAHPRSLNPRAPFLNFTNKDGVSAKYYIGKNKIVGTETVIDPEHMEAVLIDESHAGIVQEIHGKKELIYTFPLADSTELQFKQNILKHSELHKLIHATGKTSSEELDKSEVSRFSAGAISSRTVIAGPVMAERIKKYDITEYVPQRADETTKDYARRVSKLNDIGFINDTFKQFFTDANIGIHKLPWSEQLVLANAILEEKSQERLVSFAKNFGIDGVRALATADYGPDSVQKILNFAEKLPEYSKELFKYYADIIESTEKISQSSSLVGEVGVSEEARERFPIELKEALNRKAKDILLAAEVINRDSQMSEGQHISALAGLSKIMEIIEGFSGDSFNQPGTIRYQLQRRETNGPAIFNVTDKTGFEYQLKLFTRSEQSNQGQARINIELGFDTQNPNQQLREAFNQTTTFLKKNKTKTESVLRIGLDLEDRADTPILSLDLGRNALNDSEIKRSGDILAKVQQLMSKEGSHTQDSFSRLYAPYFKNIAGSFQKFIDQRVEQARQQYAIAIQK